MTDNVAITEGTGTSIATDDVAGVQYQRIKLTDGTADSDTPAIVDANGSLQVTGRGTAGSEDSGVLTVQGTASMTAIQVDVRRINGSAVTVDDFNTGASTNNVVIEGIALPSATGPVIGGTATNPIKVDPTGTTTQPVSVSSLPLPTGAATETTLTAIKTAVEGTVTVDGTVTADPSTSATATQTQVNDSATDVTILASNTSRKGATITNTSTANLFIRLGTTAATTSNYTVKLVTDAYYEVPFHFTGAIHGIWASDPGTGSANVTELT